MSEKKDAQKENFNFGYAIEELKQGKRISRSGWNGKGMFVFLNMGNIAEPVPINPDGLTLVEGIRQDLFVLGDKGTTTRLPNINMKAASGSTVTGWLASQTDMLAEDWCILD